MIRFLNSFYFNFYIPIYFIFTNLVVDITEGNVEPLPIAFLAVSKGDAEVSSENILRVISNDLVSTGLFNVVDKSRHI